MTHYDYVIENAIILSSNYDYISFRGHVAIQDKIIVKITEDKIDYDKKTVVIDAKDKILMPGLFNCHCHGDMTLARGLGDDLTLLEQNEKYATSNWFKHFITDEDRYFSRQLTYLEALLSGTTFIVENMYWSLGLDAVNAMTETGIKGALVDDARVDFQNSENLQDIEYLKEFKVKCQEKGLVPMVGSVSEENFDFKTLDSIEALLKSVDLPKTFHLAENTWRVDLIQKQHETTPVDFLFKNGYIDDKTLGSHVVYVNDEEIEQLKKAKTSVVNTPTCEMKIDDGVAPIAKMVDKGVNVCLGTDGSMWNNSNDIFREMRNTALFQTAKSGIRSITKEAILDMGTINGAKAMNLESDYGSIEVGKKASLILLDTSRPHMRPMSTGEDGNVASLVVFSASGQDVNDVFVDGQWVVKDKNITTIDIDKIMKINDGILNKIQEKLKKENYNEEK